MESAQISPGTSAEGTENAVVILGARWKKKKALQCPDDSPLTQETGPVDEMAWSSSDANPSPSSRGHGTSDNARDEVDLDHVRLSMVANATESTAEMEETCQVTVAAFNVFAAIDVDESGDAGSRTRKRRLSVCPGLMDQEDIAAAVSMWAAQAASNGVAEEASEFSSSTSESDDGFTDDETQIEHPRICSKSSSRLWSKSSSICAGTVTHHIQSRAGSKSSPGKVGFEPSPGFNDRSRKSESHVTFSQSSEGRLPTTFRRHSTSTLIGPSSRSAPRLEMSNKSGVDGILVHGCHLQADGWEDIVWGHPPNKLGRLPHAVLMAVQLQVEVVVLGTGASVSPDGRLEGKYTLDYLMEHLSQLHDFTAFRKYPISLLKHIVTKSFVAEQESQNTLQEVQAAFLIWTARKVTRGFLVSSPTHLPRCLACACQAISAHGGEKLFAGELNASPSETCYEGFTADDVVVVEPPHRGDRDRELDQLPFHEMVRRCFKISVKDKAHFLAEFDVLLKKYGA